MNSLPKFRNFFTYCIFIFGSFIASEVKAQKNCHEAVEDIASAFEAGDLDDLTHKLIRFSGKSECGTARLHLLAHFGPKTFSEFEVYEEEYLENEWRWNIPEKIIRIVNHFQSQNDNRFYYFVLNSLGHRAGSGDATAAAALSEILYNQSSFFASQSRAATLSVFQLEDSEEIKNGTFSWLTELSSHFRELAAELGDINSFRFSHISSVPWAEKEVKLLAVLSAFESKERKISLSLYREALTFLGNEYSSMTPLGGSPSHPEQKDDRKAFEFYSRDTENERAFSGMARHLSHGAGVEADHKKASRYVLYSFLSGHTYYGLADGLYLKELDRSTIKEVQVFLNKIGYETGFPDGIVGRRTLAATMKLARDCKTRLVDSGSSEFKVHSPELEWCL